MANTSIGDYSRAVNDFRRARRKAGLVRILSRLSRQSPDLLSYDEVRQKLKGKETPKVELREIPLDAIVGSVGRYDDFTRGFLPRTVSDKDRWARVKLAVSDLVGLPPIEVYQIGEVYFVLDGNHRVSVARDLEATHIEAYVRQVDTKVPLSRDVEPDDLIAKAEYAEFLERTSFDELKTEADLSITCSGCYQVLEDQISAHRQASAQLTPDEPGSSDAALTWYEHVYLPVTEIIREQNLLSDFPKRTVADLYVWITSHRDELEQALGWEISMETAAESLAQQASPTPMRKLSRARERVADVITPDALESGPASGRWRAEDQRRGIFSDGILVAVTGLDSGWDAVDQALTFAKRENVQLHGLHVVPDEPGRQSEAVAKVAAEFGRRSEQAGIRGDFGVGIGQVSRVISERARWSDLSVLRLSFPPGDRPVDRISSNFRKLIHRCPTPILAVPGPARAVGKALLAYDGSHKAEEALYVATYLGGRWKIPLVVLSVSEAGRPGKATAKTAEDYIQSAGAECVTVLKSGSVGEAILATATEHECDFIIMGGYGHSPVVHAVLGSSLDHVLRSADRPNSSSLVR
jgi:nucleotide-binding universal stress UspA family protein